MHAFFEEAETNVRNYKKNGSFINFHELYAREKKFQFFVVVT